MLSTTYKILSSMLMLIKCRLKSIYCYSGYFSFLMTVISMYLIFSLFYTVTLVTKDKRHIWIDIFSEH